MKPDIGLGFGYALLSLFFFTIYAMPRRYVNSGSMEYMVAVCSGALFATATGGFLLSQQFGGVALAPKYVLLSYLAGFSWYTATLCFVYATDCIGLGRAASVRNLTIAIGAVFGVVLFGEYSLAQPVKLLYMALGAGGIIVAASIVSRVSNLSAVVRPSCPLNLVKSAALVELEDKRADLVGGVFGLVAAFFYALYNVPGKIVMNASTSPWPYFFYIGQGAFIACLIGYSLFTNIKMLKRVPAKDHALGFFAGCLWAAAFGSMLLAMRQLGLAIAWSIANLSAVPQLFISIAVFREIDVRAHRRPIVLGTAAALVGVLLLGLSKL